MKNLFLTLIFLSFLFLANGQSNCWNSGTGADGAYHAIANTTIAGGTYNFTTFKIDAGVTVNVTGNAPLIVRCTGTATINGNINANGGNGTDGVTFTSAGIGGIGVAGGGNGGAGFYASGSPGSAGANGSYTGSGTGGLDWSGGGGAGYATLGLSSGGSTGGFGGIAYGTSNLVGLYPGSGGGGGSGGNSCGSGGGGAGGGVIVFNTDSLVIGTSGVISCKGGNGGSDGTGNCGAGGAGSGGAIWIAANNVSNSGLISAQGGTGGASAIPGTPYFGVGGNGAAGRIRMDYNSLIGSGTVNPSPVTSFGLPVVSNTYTLCNGNSITVGSNVYSTSGTYHDTVPATTGCDSIITSILTVLPALNSSQTFTLCAGDSIIVGTNTYTTSGIYIDVLVGFNSCDSAVTTNLTIENPIDNSTSIFVGGLTSNQAGAMYSWIDCDSGNSPISGANNQSFLPTANGNYAVVVTVNNCSDTSACFAYNIVGLTEISSQSIQLFPNPTQGEITVKINGANIPMSIDIYDNQGKIVFQSKVETDEVSMNLERLKSGIYFMHLYNDNTNQRIKFIRD